MKVPAGSVPADGHSLRHSAGLGRVRACAGEGHEPLREGQRVRPDVENDQQEQQLREQRPRVLCRHPQGTAVLPLCSPREMLCAATRCLAAAFSYKRCVCTRAVILPGTNC